VTNEFKPPNYVEHDYYIFDRQTGEILAVERRWALGGADTAPSRGPSQELLAGIGRGAGRTPEDLDVLAAPSPPAGSRPVRVDPQRRELVTDQRAPEPSATFQPRRLSRP
jgi:hypothetical protein